MTASGAAGVTVEVAPGARAERVLPPAPRSRWPRYEEDEIAAVVDVLRSGRVNALHHGERCRAFEHGFAAVHGASHAIALANGTLALELALRALAVGPGDEVVVSPRSFMASAGCVRAVGAMPVFADIDPVSQTLTAATIRPVLTARTRAVIVVHLAGWPAPMDPIVDLARDRGIRIVEDCAQAHGATLDGRPVGSFGDAAAFSFCTDKIMSTGGEGGMLLLRDRAAWRAAWAYKDHGKDPDAVRAPGDGLGFRWLHDGFGSNYRMTEMQAAIGLCQLAKLPGWLARRRANADALAAELAGASGLRHAVPPAGVGHAFYRFHAFVRPEALRAGWSRERIVAEAAAAGVPVSTGTCPEIYRERAFTDAGIGPPQPLPNAAELGRTSIVLPVDHTLDPGAMRVFGSRLRAVLDRAAI